MVASTLMALLMISRFVSRESVIRQAQTLQSMQKPYLDFTFKFLGFTKIHHVVVEGTQYPGGAEPAEKTGLEKAQALALTWDQ